LRGRADRLETTPEKQGGKQGGKQLNYIPVLDYKEVAKNGG
jgi:hypothetical protein